MVSEAYHANAKFGVVHGQGFETCSLCGVENTLHMPYEDWVSRPYYITCVHCLDVLVRLGERAKQKYDKLMATERPQFSKSKGPAPSYKEKAPESEDPEACYEPNTGWGTSS